MFAPLGQPNYLMISRFDCFIGPGVIREILTGDQAKADPMMVIHRLGRPMGVEGCLIPLIHQEVDGRLYRAARGLAEAFRGMVVDPPEMVARISLRPLHQADGWR